MHTLKKSQQLDGGDFLAIVGREHSRQISRFFEQTSEELLDELDEVLLVC